MTYSEVRALLDTLPRFEVKPGLERTRRLLDVLDHPEDRFPAIHVAGTNGKGSIVAMLASVLQQAGLRVGRYTSPEVLEFRDRIVVNGDWISEQELADGVSRMQGALAGEDVPSQFEAITALALEHFARHAVDIAVVEVGLGGRFDATNVVSPVLTVLSNVAIDHQWILGESLEEIAWEKAGIAKAGVPLVHGSLAAPVLKIVSGECENVGAIAVSAEDTDVVRTSVDWDAARYRATLSGRGIEIELPLLGGYQLENLRLVLRTIELLREQGLIVPDQAVVEGLRTVEWPGRFEVVRRAPTIVLEGAHNVAGARVLATDIASMVPEQAHRHVVFGVLADKDARGMLDALVPAFGRIALCQSESPRALRVRELHERAAARSLGVAWYHSVDEAMEAVLPSLGEADVLVVAGSLTVVAEARRGLMEGRWKR